MSVRFLTILILFFNLLISDPRGVANTEAIALVFYFRTLSLPLGRCSCKTIWGKLPPLALERFYIWCRNAFEHLLLCGAIDSDAGF